MRGTGRRIVIKAWLAAHKSLSVTALSGFTILAVVATIAITSSGYTAQQMQLGDAAVWVSNQSKQLVGRANTEIKQLNSVVAAASSATDVVQSGGTVLLVDHGDNTVGTVDPATASVGKAVPLPAREPAVNLVGPRVAIDSAATGQVWLMNPDALGQFDAQTAPTLDLGGRIVSAVDPSGRFFAYLPETGTVYTIDAATNDSIAATDRTRTADKSHSVAVSAVGGQWAVLDSTDGTLSTASGRVNLPAWLGLDVALQRAADTGDVVYLASNAGLVAVPLNGGPARTVLRGALGKPAAPVVVDGCVYAAWAGGSTYSRCGGSAGVRGVLSQPTATAALSFRVNQHDVVLNDTDSGRSWAVQHGNALIDNWSDFAQKNTNREQTQQNDQEIPPTVAKEQQPPVAVDDVFGARPGKVSTLPVLLNDYDPNGDVLVIASIDPPPTSLGTVDIVANDQQLQLTLPSSAAGSFTFHYTISDGRGGTATAAVTVQVRTPEENSPPVQVRATRVTVGSGGRMTTQVLSDWYDPDGDPFYLSSATIDGPDSVTYTPQGTVVYSDRGEGGSQKTVALTASDGRATGSGRLLVTVTNPQNVPITAEPFVQTATAGEEITVAPLAHASGGSGTLRLSAVPAIGDAVITADFDAGTFRFTSGTVGTHLVDFTVTDGITTANGIARIEVKAPPDGKTQPITVPHTVFIQEQSTHEVDVLATDIDPAGGVLLITGVTNVPPASGLRVEVLQHQLLRVTLTRPLDAPIMFNYHVTNGLADADGTVTVVQIPAPAVRQPPVANPDSVSVRVGDAIDIPVLGNDTQPDGDELTLDPTLATPLPPGAGLLFASGSVLRYLAPNKPGNYTAAYRVDAPDGQWASALVTIAVRELDAASNNPPVPKTVTARVLAGESVRIPIPLNGIDPDGDSVKLVGQESNPAKGAVTAIGPDWIDYTAGDYSTGLDTFSYGVVDALGAHASGTVRIGIAAAPSGARNPVAVEDEVTVRPGRTVSVQVLANDSDPDNSPLTITKVTPTTGGGAKAKIVGDVIQVITPRAEGRYGFIYEIQNQTGGTSSNFLTVVVRKDAPLARPQVSDTVLALSDILGKQSLNVDVLANVFFADGPVGSLNVRVLPGYQEQAQVTARKRVHVKVTAKSQIIPFSVSHPDDASVVSYGFIWVPGTDDALPQLKRDAPKLSVPSETALTIHLNDYVVAVGGKKVRLTDASTVHATHSNGASLVQGDDTLVFTSAARYFGPASLSFEVTDGSSTRDPNGHVATLVLPITVTPRQNQPPVFTGGQIDFEPGQQKAIDLLKLTRYPYAKDQKELSYQILDPRPDGFALSLSGTTLAISAGDKTAKGTTATVLVSVRDALNDGQAGRINLTVVPSTRPLAVPAPDSVIARRGQTTSVDVLANDNATNPFPNSPLRVIAVRGLESGSLPAGVSVTPSADNSRLTVSVASSAQAADTDLQYEVADATGDPSRYAWGTVRISVQDRPDPIANLQATGVGDRNVSLAWAAGAFNNSAILDYQVTVTRDDNGQPVSTTTCTSTTCTVPTGGNGPNNAVRIGVTARNAIGVSDVVNYGAAIWSNIVPPAPSSVTAVPLDHGARVSWSAPDAASGASAVTSYRVSIGGVSVTVPANTFTTELTDPSIANGTAVTASVASINSYFGQQPTWNSATASVTPAGPPLWSGTPVASAATDGSGTVTLNWSGLVSGNGADVTRLTAAAFQGGVAPSCDQATGAVSGGGQLQSLAPGASTATFTVQSGQQWSFGIFAFNGQGCAVSPIATATPLAPPAAPRSIAVALPSEQRPTGSAAFTFLAALTNISAPAGTNRATVTYQFRFVGAFTSDPQPIARGDSIDVGPQNYGRSATVQFRAISDYGSGVVLAGAWSADVAAGVAVNLDVGASFAADSAGHGGTYSWTKAPTVYDSITAQCSGQVAAVPMAPTGSCVATGSAGAGPTLTVAATANNQTYTKIYRG
ncbi:Ig-like domain-containing protein [Rathayibacter soli]|uniref:Ig-like domain-containing protein n=1 Tax=Rathayibacter soli TaxID=3144168 RepID=UPI0027E4A7B2|nr:Ig-like domain-containing protein [Glaciibacter superstes]